MTGNILFEDGVRIDYSFDIIELVTSGVSKVGTWTEETGPVFSREKLESATIDEMSLVNKTFTVLLSKVSI